MASRHRRCQAARLPTKGRRTMNNLALDFSRTKRLSARSCLGKGIALQFERKWPANFKAYESACKRGEGVPSKMFVFDYGGLVEPKFIINFPTKRHWWQPSRLADIGAGLIVPDVTLKSSQFRPPL